MDQDLGLVDSLTPESIGEPGQRTFKITATSSRGEAIVWMEKEQLFQISVSVKQLTATRNEPSQPVQFVPDSPPGPFPIAAEFKTGELALKHDGASDVFTLKARSGESEEEDPSAQPDSVQFSFTRRLGEQMADRALAIVAAGRKPCPLCGGPINPDGHFCVKVNGHRQSSSRD